MKATVAACFACLALGLSSWAQDDVRAEFKKRLAAIDQSDVSQLLDLADWANESRLKASAGKLYHKVLTIEPDNEDAHKALGHRLADGRWLTRKEYRKWKRKVDAEKKAAGGGAAPKKPTAGHSSKKPKKSTGNKTPAGKVELPEVDIKPFVEKAAEADKKEAETFADMLGVDFAAATSEHFQIKAQGTLEDVEKNLTYCEGIYAGLCKIFGQPLDKPLWNGHAMFYMFEDEANFLDSFSLIERRWSKVYGFNDPAAMQLMRSTGRFGLDYSRNPGKYASLNVGYIDIPDEAYYSNCVGKAFASYYGGPHRVPGRYTNWLDEGLAMFTSIHFFGKNMLYRVTNAKYVGRSGVKDKNADTAYKLVCKEMAEGVLEQKPFAHLCRTKLNDLDYKDLAKSWSLVCFLADQHLEKFCLFLKEFRKVERHGDEKPELALDRHIDRKLEKVFGWKAEDLDSAWMAWVKENY